MKIFSLPGLTFLFIFSLLGKPALATDQTMPGITLRECRISEFKKFTSTTDFVCENAYAPLYDDGGGRRYGGANENGEGKGGGATAP